MAPAVTSEMQLTEAEELRLQLFEVHDDSWRWQILSPDGQAVWISGFANSREEALQAAQLTFLWIEGEDD